MNNLVKFLLVNALMSILSLSCTPIKDSSSTDVGNDFFQVNNYLMLAANKPVPSLEIESALAVLEYVPLTSYLRTDLDFKYMIDYSATVNDGKESYPLTFLKVVIGDFPEPSNFARVEFHYITEPHPYFGVRTAIEYKFTTGFGEDFNYDCIKYEINDSGNIIVTVNIDYSENGCYLEMQNYDIGMVTEQNLIDSGLMDDYFFKPMRYINKFKMQLSRPFKEGREDFKLYGSIPEINY